MYVQQDSLEIILYIILFYFILALSSLATTSKFQSNICLKMKAVGLININTKECN